jgi:hypothetical protein
MFGLQEILIVVGIVGVIIFLPRMQARKRSPLLLQPVSKASGKMRLGIAVSVLYPLAMAAFLKPWQNDPFMFVYIGLGPVALGWLVRWVWLGFRRK